jgi:predicted phosphohydrolase
MKIQYCSDLHLEFRENLNYVNKHLLQIEGEILLLAGDILPFVMNHRDFTFFDFIADNFEAVYWVPGNHEYYGSDIGKISNPLFEKIRSNVFLINNQTIVYKDVNIICSTLWSHIRPENEWAIKKNLTDFFTITNNGEPLLPVNFNEFHQTCLSFIKGEVSRYEGSKSIVLTHHVPTFSHYPAKYKNSPLNEAFAVELHDYIVDANVKFWLYGHHHRNISSFVIGNTTLLTNQLGYVRQYEHGSYKRNAFFEI